MKTPFFICTKLSIHLDAITSVSHMKQSDYDGIVQHVITRI